MSLVRNDTPQTTDLNEVGETSPDVVSHAVEATEPVTNTESAPGGIFNVTLHGVYTPEELTEGVVFQLSDYSVGNIPKDRVIVSEVASTAIGSHIGSNLMVSSNLFNGSDAAKHYLESGVSNAHGWATVNDQDELVPLGYAPIVSIMPNEYCRTKNVHYAPSSGVDDKLVARYGHLTSGDNLRNGVVAFPGEDYYFVAKDHVVLDIIEKNWDALGQSVPHERVREGNWIKVSNALVDKVLDELDTSVLRNMPLTDLGNLNFAIKADPELADHLSNEEAHPVSVTLSLAYRNVAPSAES